MFFLNILSQKEEIHKEWYKKGKLLSAFVDAFVIVNTELGLIYAGV